MNNHFDVIVVGVGSMGSSTCYHLARAGHNVLGIEQFVSPHDHGSHSGETRIIRKAYFEHPDYVPLLERAYASWNEFEETCGQRIYHETGILYIGKPDNENIKGIELSATKYSIPLEKYSSKECRQRLPMVNVPGDFIGLFEPEAGFLLPDLAISLYIKHALASGATILQNENAIAWKKSEGSIEVTTEKQVYRCDKLIITAGAWTSRLVRNLQIPLNVTEQWVGWVKPTDRKSFALGNFPCWFVEDPELGTFYGFPDMRNSSLTLTQGMKLAHHAPGRSVDPDVAGIQSSGFGEVLGLALEKYLPSAVGPVLESKRCMYTYTPDSHFLIDHLPDMNKQVVIACGFSGHGFKFASVIGEILCELAIDGKTKQPINFLNLKRFNKK